MLPFENKMQISRGKEELSVTVESKKSRAVQFISWGMVVFWMAVIFWFSSHPADESVRWSVGVMRLGGEVLSNWQWVGLIVFIILYHLFLIWLARMSAPLVVKILLFSVFILISLGIVYVLYTTIRPRVSSLGLFQMNRWVIHRHLRKTAHFFIYLFLGSFLMNALTVSGVKWIKAFVMSILISFFYAVSDELHQYFVPGRTPLVMDVIIDTVGATVGVLLYSTLNQLIQWIRQYTAKADRKQEVSS